MNAAIYGGKGLALDSLGRYADAVKMYDRAIKFDPTSGALYGSKGLALRKLGRYEDAIKMYDRAIELDPKSADAYGNKGYVLIYLKRYDDAVESLSKAITLNDKSPAQHNNMALALMKRNRGNDAQKAREISEQVLKEDSKGKSSAYAYANLGKKNEMLALLKRLIAKDTSIAQDVKTDMEFDPYRDDLRFKSIVGDK